MAMLLCETCGRAFDKPSLLKRHAAVHRTEKLYKCPECSLSFTQNSSLQRHIKQSHRGERRYKCPHCAQSFAQHCNLKLHIQRTHSLDKTSFDNNHFACNLCECVFQRKSSLRRHQTLCHKKDAHVAADNSLLTPTDDPDILAKNVLEQLKHLQQDLDLKYNSEFDVNEELNITEEVNNNADFAAVLAAAPVTFVDDVAAQTVTLKDRLNPQKETNLFSVLSVQRPNERKCLVCEFCGKEFSKSYDLIRHRRVHTKERPYQCSVCTQSFPTQHKLNKHRRKHILDEQTGLFAKQYNCLACEQKFDSIKKLDAHTLSHCPEDRVS